MRTDKRPTYGQRLPRPTAQGYVAVYAPEHPLAMADGYVLQHRMVAWDEGILTDPAWQVHHKDEDRRNNDPANLVAMPNGEHQREHHNAPGSYRRNQHGGGVIGQGVNTLRLQRRAAAGQRSCARCGVDITERRIDAKVCPACRFLR